MRKIITTMAFVGLVLTAGAGVALAGHQDRTGPGPNGHNNHGLCTALFNGSENGRGNKQNAGPFAALISESPDGPSDDDDTGGSISDAWDWCSDPVNNPGGIGGQPEDPTTPEAEGNGKNGKGKG